MLFEIIETRAHEGLELGPSAVGGVHLAQDWLDQLDQAPPQGFQIDLLLRWKILIDGSFCESGRGGDVIDGDVAEAALAENLAGGVEDFRAAELGNYLLFGAGVHCSMPC